MNPDDDTFTFDLHLATLPEPPAYVPPVPAYDDSDIGRMTREQLEDEVRRLRAFARENRTFSFSGGS